VEPRVAREVATPNRKAGVRRLGQARRAPVGGRGTHRAAIATGLRRAAVGARVTAPVEAIGTREVTLAVGARGHRVRRRRARSTAIAARVHRGVVGADRSARVEAGVA
jgi:hypothetical protein